MHDPKSFWENKDLQYGDQTGSLDNLCKLMSCPFSHWWVGYWFTTIYRSHSFSSCHQNGNFKCNQVFFNQAKIVHGFGKFWQLTCICLAFDLSILKPLLVLLFSIVFNLFQPTTWCMMCSLFALCSTPQNVQEYKLSETTWNYSDTYWTSKLHAINYLPKIRCVETSSRKRPSCLSILISDHQIFKFCRAVNSPG